MLQRKHWSFCIVIVAGAFSLAPHLLLGADLPKEFAVVPREVQKGGADYGGDATDFDTVTAFSEFAWRSFIALNWPAVDWPKGRSDRGVADTSKSFSDLTRPRVWETFKAGYEMIPKQPAAGAVMEPRLWNLVDDITPAGGKTIDIPKVFGSYTPFGDISQAQMAGPLQGAEGPLGSPLACQNRTYTHFEVRMNRPQFSAIRGEGFYLREVIDNHMLVSSDAAGDNKVPFEFPHGATTVKAAWRELLPKEDASTFYTREAPVADYSSGLYDTRKLGLVGLHIVQKTPLRQQWVWASFEHIANVPGLASTMSYSYNNGTALSTSVDPGPIGEGVPTNSYVSPTPSPALAPTEVVRELKLHDATKGANKMYHDMLPEDSVWRNYFLVVTQWPTQPNADATATELEGKPFPKEPGGKGAVFSVANTTMETWFQSYTSCIGCHELAEAAGFDYVFFPAMHADKAPGAAIARESVSAKFMLQVRDRIRTSVDQSRSIFRQRNQ